MTTLREFCKQQVARFGGLPGWPDPVEYPGAVRDLVDTVERLSKGDRDFMTRLVTTCKETSRFCPTVIDLRTIAGEMRAVESRGARRGFKGCVACDWSGWRRETRGYYDFASPCPECRKPTANAA